VSELNSLAQSDATMPELPSGNMLTGGPTPSLAPATWTGIQTNAGTGGPLNFSFPITPANPQQFFRISVQ